ncbi:uncharacterized protein LOC106644794 [Copidosoma floridanum]|uniref:uncharacterized protein LOC106644794 n=1 Tax=Copidosoma floridanum TaxID=29053 RepID=UPI0006C9BE5B|nr:uncharacterized protein LOC106644794 [Copidosoma floridanum]
MGDKKCEDQLSELKMIRARHNVAPLNMKSDNRKLKTSTFNSITGMLSSLKRSFPDVRNNKSLRRALTQHDYSSEKSGFFSESDQLLQQVDMKLNQLTQRMCSVEESIADDIHIIMNLLRQTVNLSKVAPCSKAPGSFSVVGLNHSTTNLKLENRGEIYKNQQPARLDIPWMF